MVWDLFDYLPIKLCFLTEVWLKPSHLFITPYCLLIFSPSNLFTILPIMVENFFVHLFLEVTPSFYMHLTWVVSDSSSWMEKLGTPSILFLTFAHPNSLVIDLVFPLNLPVVFKFYCDPWTTLPHNAKHIILQWHIYSSSDFFEDFKYSYYLEVEIN